MWNIIFPVRDQLNEGPQQQDTFAPVQEDHDLPAGAVTDKETAQRQTLTNELMNGLIRAMEHHEPAGALLPPGDREHGQGPRLPSHLRGHRDQRLSGSHALPGLRRRPRLLVLQGHFDRGVRAKIHDRLTKQQRTHPGAPSSNQDTGSAGFCTTFSLSYFGRIDRSCRIH